jgi:hypothetical protein
MKEYCRTSATEARRYKELRKGGLAEASRYVEGVHTAFVIERKYVK